MRRLTAVAIASLSVLPAALAAAACSSPPEHAILNQYFRASRLRDTTSLASFSVVRFDPNTHGTVSSFDIVTPGAEQRQPLPTRALADEHEGVRAEEAAFTARKNAFQVANMDAITRVLKAEQQGGPVSPNDAEVHATWTKLRDESSEHARRLSESERRLASGTALVRLSLDGTGADPASQDGEMVAKDVTIEASVRTPDGASVDKIYVVTMQRAVLKGNPEIAGKWIITAIRDAAAPPVIRTS